MSDLLLCQMMKLVIKVMDLDEREKFGDRVLTAWTAKDEKEMYKVGDALYVHLQTKPVTDADIRFGAQMRELRTQLALWSSDDFRVLETSCRELGVEFRLDADPYRLAELLTLELNGTAVDVEPATLEVEDRGRKKQTGFAYFYRYNYIEIDREVKAKNPESQARDVTDALFLLWDSLTKEEQKEWTDSAPENPYA